MAPELNRFLGYSQISDNRLQKSRIIIIIKTTA